MHLPYTMRRKIAGKTWLFSEDKLICLENRGNLASPSSRVYTKRRKKQEKTWLFTENSSKKFGASAAAYALPASDKPEVTVGLSFSKGENPSSSPSNL
jgi:hypothetical protein